MNTTDFLEIVTFLKDDDKYTKRLKELDAAEASLKAKLAIADSVDKAQKLQTAAYKAATQADVEREAYAKAHAKRVADLEKQFADKQAVLDEKWAKLQEDRVKVAVATVAAKEAQSAAAIDKAKAEKIFKEATLVRQLADEKEAKVRAKLSKLKAVIEES